MYNDKKHIIALKGPEDILIDLGLTVLVRKLKYKVNIIERIPNEILSISNKVEYHISMAKRTKASTFLMPMLPGTKKLYFWNNHALKLILQNNYIEKDVKSSLFSYL